MVVQEDIRLLRRFGARLWLQIPKRLDVWRSRGCWVEGEYESVRSTSGAQLWLLGDSSSCPPLDTIGLALHCHNQVSMWEEAFFTVPAGPVMLTYKTFQQEGSSSTGKGLWQPLTQVWTDPLETHGRGRTPGNLPP